MFFLLLDKQFDNTSLGVSMKCVGCVCVCVQKNFFFLQTVCDSLHNSSFFHA
jgi:hypothetical protein